MSLLKSTNTGINTIKDLKLVLTNLSKNTDCGTCSNWGFHFLYEDVSFDVFTRGEHNENFFVYVLGWDIDLNSLDDLIAFMMYQIAFIKDKTHHHKDDDIFWTTLYKKCKKEVKEKSKRYLEIKNNIIKFAL